MFCVIIVGGEEGDMFLLEFNDMLLEATVPEGKKAGDLVTFFLASATGDGALANAKFKGTLAYPVSLCIDKTIEKALEKLEEKLSKKALERASKVLLTEATTAAGAQGGAIATKGAVYAFAKKAGAAGKEFGLLATKASTKGN